MLPGSDWSVESGVALAVLALGLELDQPRPGRFEVGREVVVLAHGCSPAMAGHATCAARLLTIVRRCAPWYNAPMSEQPAHTDPDWPYQFVVNRKEYEALVNLLPYARHRGTCSTSRIPVT